MIVVEWEYIIESFVIKIVFCLFDKFIILVRFMKVIELDVFMISRILEGDFERKKEFDIEFGRIVKLFIIR